MEQINGENKDQTKRSARNPAGKVSPASLRLKEIISPPSLTSAELTQLEHCEAIIQTGLDTFFEVGIALLTIREGRLYRAKFSAFDSYCRDRWGIGSSYARRVIRAAERVKLLPDDGTIQKPTSEFQVRPFLQLEPEVFPKAWRQLITRSHGEKISTSLVKKVVAEFSSPQGESAHTRKTADEPRNRGRFGEVFTWLHEARKRVQSGQTDEALAAIDRVEDVLSRHL